MANEGDCGLGTREGTRTGADCKQTIKTQRCKIPCNWKKKFGGKAQTPAVRTLASARRLIRGSAEQSSAAVATENGGVMRVLCHPQPRRLSATSGSFVPAVRQQRVCHR